MTLEQRRESNSEKSDSINFLLSISYSCKYPDFTVYFDKLCSFVEMLHKAYKYSFINLDHYYDQ